MRKFTADLMMQSTFTKPPPFVRELVSPESLAKTDYFDSKTVVKHFQNYLDQPDKRRRSLVVEMALSTVMATQLRHHIYIDSSLCELPRWT